MNIKNLLSKPFALEKNENDTCIICNNVIDELFWWRAVETIDKKSLESKIVLMRVCDQCGGISLFLLLL